MEPPIMDTLKSGQPPYNRQTVHPLHIYCPYISTSEAIEQNARPQCVYYLVTVAVSLTVELLKVVGEM